MQIIIGGHNIEALTRVEGVFPDVLRVTDILLTKASSIPELSEILTLITNRLDIATTVQAQHIASSLLTLMEKYPTPPIPSSAVKEFLDTIPSPLKAMVGGVPSLSVHPTFFRGLVSLPIAPRRLTAMIPTRIVTVGEDNYISWEDYDLIRIVPPPPAVPTPTAIRETIPPPTVTVRITEPTTIKFSFTTTETTATSKAVLLYRLNWRGYYYFGWSTLWNTQFRSFTEVGITLSPGTLCFLDVQSNLCGRTPRISWRRMS